MSGDTKNYFKLKKLTKFADLEANPELILPESDLCFQNQEYIAQFEHVDLTNSYVTTIEPGVYTMVRENGRVALQETQLKVRQLLKSIVNTQAILKEASLLFERPHVYERRNWPKKRAVLLYSDPGMGKSAAITQFISDSVAQDAGTVVMLWPTSELEASDISKFLSVQSEYSSKCTRVILVIEDIGGQVHEGYGGPRTTDASMLNLLDGINVTFKLSTFIAATTNYPQNLLANLADRPGRFDQLIHLKAPAYKERIELLEFIAMRPLTDEEKTFFKCKDADDFSIAHLEEVVIRSELHDKTLIETFKELVDHKKLFKQAFEKSKSVGFGGNDD